jgi:predicted deacetylase
MPLPTIGSTLQIARSYVDITYDVTTVLATTGLKEIKFTSKLVWQEKTNVYEISKKVAVSAPMYVLWSLDWEGIQANKASMDAIEAIRAQSPNLKIVHMFNPRIWNTTKISKSVADSEIVYIKDKLAKYGDEVALHMHMFRDMVETAKVTVLTTLNWSNRSDGYDTPFSAYSYDDAKTLLNWAVSEFARKGLPRPVTFRAGGWFINSDNLRALKDTGFIIDTSGRTKYSSRNISSIGDRVDGFWNLLSTTQPYWISKSNQNVVASKPELRNGVFEIPNNGGDSWAYTPEAMIGKFKENYYSDILPTTRVITYLSHPDFLTTEGPKIEQVLLRTRYYSSYADSGPVMYITMKEYYEQYAK